MLASDDPHVAGPVFAIDAAFGAMAVQVGAEQWGLAGLTPRECALLCLATDVCTGTLGLPFSLHVEAALRAGVARWEIREAIRYLAPDAGYPMCLAALAPLNEIDATNDHDAGGHGGDRPVHVEAAPPTAAPPGLDAARDADLTFGDYLSLRVGALWRRPGLAPKERSYLSLAVDVCYQTLGAPYRLHVTSAVGSGATAEQLRAVLRFLAEFSGPKA